MLMPDPHDVYTAGLCADDGLTPDECRAVELEDELEAAGYYAEGES